jgi:hypothetical protein
MTVSGDGCSVCCSDSFQSSYTSSSDPRDRQPVGVANPMGTKLPYTTIVAAGPFAGYVFRVLCRKSYPEYGNRKTYWEPFVGSLFSLLFPYESIEDIFK